MKRVKGSVRFNLITSIQSLSSNCTRTKFSNQRELYVSTFYEISRTLRFYLLWDLQAPWHNRNHLDTGSQNFLQNKKWGKKPQINTLSLIPPGLQFVWKGACPVPSVRKGWTYHWPSLGSGQTPQGSLPHLQAAPLLQQHWAFVDLILWGRWHWPSRNSLKQLPSRTSAESYFFKGSEEFQTRSDSRRAGLALDTSHCSTIKLQ